MESMGRAVQTKETSRAKDLRSECLRIMAGVLRGQEHEGRCSQRSSAGTDHGGPCGHYKDFAFYSEEFRSHRRGLSRAMMSSDLCLEKILLAVILRIDSGGLAWWRSG